MKPETLKKAKEAHPGAEVLIHPECVPETLEMADYIGSTSGIIEYAGKSEAKSFIVCTEDGVLYELKKKNPGKEFFLAKEDFCCPGMKRITAGKVLEVLEHMTNQVEVSDELRNRSMAPLTRMLELAK